MCIYVWKYREDICLHIHKWQYFNLIYLWYTQCCYLCYLLLLGVIILQMETTNVKQSKKEHAVCICCVCVCVYIFQTMVVPELYRRYWGIKGIIINIITSRLQSLLNAQNPSTAKKKSLGCLFFLFFGVLSISSFFCCSTYLFR